LLKQAVWEHLELVYVLFQEPLNQGNEEETLDLHYRQQHPPQRKLRGPFHLLNCDLTCDLLPALACDAPGHGILLRWPANAGTKSQVKLQVRWTRSLGVLDFYTFLLKKLPILVYFST
jgi:hypothetical protein